MAGASGNAEKSTDLSSPAIVSRLPTFKGPRDLTLSAAARARRQYVPNIPPKRDRGESSSAPAQSPKSFPKQFAQPSLPGPSELKSRKHPPRPNISPGVGIHGGRRGGSRGRGAKPELVQSASIFSEGVGVKSVTSRRGSSSSAGRGRGRGRGSGSGRPSISTADLEDAIGTESPKKSKSVSQEDIYIDDDSDDEEPFGGSGTFIEGLSQGKLPHYLQPVSLPLDAYFTRLTTKPDGQKKTRTKAVPGDSFAQLLKSAPKGTLACLQMPYILPFQQVARNSPTNADNARTYVNNLSEVKGGCIGKIQIRKSGKCSLILGKSEKDQIAFAVDPTKMVGFRQELAAINTEKRSLTMLGKVQHKFVCAPNLDPLFK